MRSPVTLHILDAYTPKCIFKQRMRMKSHDSHNVSQKKYRYNRKIGNIDNQVADLRPMISQKNHGLIKTILIKNL